MQTFEPKHACFFDKNDPLVFYFFRYPPQWTSCLVCARIRNGSAVYEYNMVTTPLKSPLIRDKYGAVMIIIIIKLRLCSSNTAISSLLQFEQYAINYIVKTATLVVYNMILCGFYTGVNDIVQNATPKTDAINRTKT